MKEQPVDPTRRRFLKASAIGGGAAILGPSLSLAGDKETIEMTPNDAMERLFGIGPEDLHRIAARTCARGADFGDVYLEDSIATSLVMEDGKIRDAIYSEDSGAGLRAVKGEAIAFGYTQHLRPDALGDVAVQVSAISTGPVLVAGDGLTPLQRRLDLYSGDAPSVLVSARDKLSLLERADKAARAYDPKVTRVDVNLAEEIRTIGVMTSDGRFFTDVQPMLRFNVSVVAEKNGARQKGYSAGGGRMGLEYLADVSPEDIARDAARIAVTMLDARPAPAGEQVVVLAPGDSGILLHEAVGHGLEADFNRKGTSRYSGRIGERVASELCTVVDDGTLPKLRGSIHGDDEGSLSRRNVLIENGKLVDYMHDRISSLHYGHEPRGNGRRQSYRHPPLPRMTNTYMLGGPHTPEEIIESTGKGIYCKTFSGGQVNISNGDFVFQVVESYLIEDGKLTAPLKDVIIIGNGPDALSRVSMVGKDFTLSDGRWTCGKGGQSVPVGVGIPTTKIDGITVGGTE
ncbi:MAG: metallopeptidase TldD-related protein [Pseudomonadota bacterium]